MGAATVLAFSATAVVVFVYIWLGKLINSPGFSEFLASQAGEAMEAQAELKSLRWNGYSALSEGLVLIGFKSSKVDQLHAETLRVEWNWRSLFQGAWRIENIEVQKLSATFKIKERSPSEKNLSDKIAKGVALPAESEAPSSSTNNEKFPAFLAKWLPARFEFGRLEVLDANLNFDQFGTTRNALSVVAVENGHDIEARGGSLSILGIPPLTLAQCRIRERNGTYFLEDFRAFVNGGGSIVASGTLGEKKRLNLVWDNVPVNLPPVPQLGEYLTGISKGNATQKEDGSWRGSLSINGASLRGLPLMKTVASFLRNPAWANPPLQAFSADFEWSGGNLTLTNLIIESANLARIEGSLGVAAGGILSGQLQVGLDQNTLKFLPGARETVFNKARGGWNWSSVQLGGTLSHPTEDLSSRLTTSIAAGVFLDQSSKAIEAVPSTAIDTAKDLINIFAPLVP